jgi:hypothetical protein
MRENVVAAFVRRDKTVALRITEPFNYSSLALSGGWAACFLFKLRRSTLCGVTTTPPLAALGHSLFLDPEPD